MAAASCTTSLITRSCAGASLTDAETGGPYEFDRTICGEFIDRPELIEIHPFRGRNGGRKESSSRDA